MTAEEFNEMTVEEARERVDKHGLKILINKSGEFYGWFFIRGIWRPDFKEKLIILVDNKLDINQSICELWSGKAPPIFHVLSNPCRQTASAIKALVECGADINLRNEAGQTPIMVACKGRSRGELSKPSIVKALIKAGADLSLEDSKGNLVTDLADEKALPALVAAGARFNARKSHALWIAVWGKDLNLAHDLLQKGLKKKLDSWELGVRLPFLKTVAQTYPDLFHKGFSLADTKAQPAAKKAVKAFSALLDLCSASPKNSSILAADEDELPSSLRRGAWPPKAEAPTPHIEIVMPPSDGQAPLFNPPQGFDQRMRALHDQIMADQSIWDHSDVKRFERQVLEVCVNHTSREGGLDYFQKKNHQFDIGKLLMFSNDVISQFWNSCFDIYLELLYSYKINLTYVSKFDLTLYRLRADAFDGIKPDGNFAIHCLSYFDAIELAPLMARALSDGFGKAQTWLTRFPDSAIKGLLASAFSGVEIDRSDAQQALRWLSTQGFRGKIEHIAKSLGAEAHAVAMTFLDRSDEADFLPKKLAKLPAYFVASAHPAPILKGSGKALPAHAVETLCRMMMASTFKLQAPALAKVIAACDPQSLADFALSLYDNWVYNGSKSDGIEFLYALGFIGDDRAARLLIRNYRNAPYNNPTSAAISALGAIGTNIAISGLMTIMRFSKYEKARAHAQEVLENVSEARGLAPEMLEDLAVPDLGLEPNSQMTLDFGPRRFSVTLDANLDAVLTDESGNILKALPKATKSDHVQLAKAATAQWKEFKAALKGQAADQKKRFEQAMLSRREWDGSAFKEVVAAHPLLSKMVRSLVWTTLKDQALGSTFRIDPEGRYVTIEGAELTLDDETNIALPHPCLFGDKVETWLQIFAENKLTQPFPQLARKWFAEGAEAEKLIRARDCTKVPLGSLRGLKAKGWEFEIGNAGMIWSVYKSVDGGRASINVEPGWSISGADYDDFGGDQTVKLDIRCSDPIAYSELVRDFLSLPIVESQ